ncbi:LLM class flavin-dependent oxidoreductase [Isoptericola halotolerans]|uniref:LLM class flavin-dependent oxidoreductase n=1 Tax=Isoptericola halotolerans TaxID=300560 RepID=UPI00388F5B2A
MLPRDLPAHQVLGYARTAERLGFDELWVVEDLGFRGGFSQAGAVLAGSESIGVGLGILPERPATSPSQRWRSRRSPSSSPGGSPSGSGTACRAGCGRPVAGRNDR